MTSEGDSRRQTGQPAGGDARTGPAGLGWLATLRARLGLSGPQTLRDTLEEALKTEAAAETAFSETEREMMLRLLRFGTLRVDDIMVPRADIIAIDEAASLAELLAKFREAGVSRIPLYHETLDDPRGMVHVKDLLRFLMGDAEPREPARPLDAAAAGTEPPGLDLARVNLARPIIGARMRRPTLHVPPSMPAINLLIQMQTTRIHMALVVDEYGGTDGLVTIEDLVEQVVGDIEDEHDVAEAANIVDDPKLGLVAQARTPVAELEARLNHKLLSPEEAEEIDTLGGLVFSIVARIPSRGEIIRHTSGVEFEVLDADPRRVKRLKVHVPPGISSGQTAAAAKAEDGAGSPPAQPDGERRQASG